MRVRRRGRQRAAYTPPRNSATAARTTGVRGSSPPRSSPDPSTIPQRVHHRTPLPKGDSHAPMAADSSLPALTYKLVPRRGKQRPKACHVMDIVHPHGKTSRRRGRQRASRETNRRRPLCRHNQTQQHQQQQHTAQALTTTNRTGQLEQTLTSGENWRRVSEPSRVATAGAGTTSGRQDLPTTPRLRVAG